jgi:hypothetical protein
MSECLTTNQPCITATGATPSQPDRSRLAKAERELRFSRISKWRPKCVRLLFCTNPGAFLSMSTEEEIRTQNDRLELLLNLTSKITSSLDLREVLRAVAANIREVIHAEGATVSLQDAA